VPREGHCAWSLSTGSGSGVEKSADVPGAASFGDVSVAKKNQAIMLYLRCFVLRKNLVLVFDPVHCESEVEAMRIDQPNECNVM
jgi:hypothetical protein